MDSGLERARPCHGLRMGEFARALPRAVRARTRSELLACGVSPRALAGPGWRQVAHGWHVPAGAAVSTTQRIVEATSMAPLGRVSGWAAAYVLGADALDGQDPFSGARQAVRVVLPSGASYRSVPGLRCVRAELDTSETEARHGFGVTTGVRTAFDLAREASDLTEAVVALDTLIRAGLFKIQPLQQKLVEADGARGVRQARLAAGLCRPGVRSPWETRLRMFVLELGLPEPQVNVPVFDLDGQFLGTPDLLDVDAGFALEFDGAGHRERDQHRRDNVREERFERGGLVVARADSLDLRAHRPELGRRILAARADAVHNRRPRRWTITEPPWWQGMPA